MTMFTSTETELLSEERNIDVLESDMFPRRIQFSDLSESRRVHFMEAITSMDPSCIDITTITQNSSTCDCSSDSSVDGKDETIGKDNIMIGPSEHELSSAGSYGRMTQLRCQAEISKIRLYDESEPMWSDIDEELQLGISASKGEVASLSDLGGSGNEQRYPNAGYNTPHSFASFITVKSQARWRLTLLRLTPDQEDAEPPHHHARLIDTPFVDFSSKSSRLPGPYM